MASGFCFEEGATRLGQRFANRHKREDIYYYYLYCCFSSVILHLPVLTWRRGKLQVRRLRVGVRRLGLLRHWLVRGGSACYAYCFVRGWASWAASLNSPVGTACGGCSEKYCHYSLGRSET